MFPRHLNASDFFVIDAQPKVFWWKPRLALLRPAAWRVPVGWDVLTRNRQAESSCRAC
jgi:hypothetical protein